MSDIDLYLSPIQMDPEKNTTSGGIQIAQEPDPTNHTSVTCKGGILAGTRHC